MSTGTRFPSSVYSSSYRSPGVGSVSYSRHLATQAAGSGRQLPVAPSSNSHVGFGSSSVPSSYTGSSRYHVYGTNRSTSNGSLYSPYGGSPASVSAVASSSYTSSSMAIQRKPLSAKTSSQLNISPSPPPPPYEEGSSAGLAASTAAQQPLLGLAEKMRDRGRVGLANLGNTCYLNSIVQCLSHTRPLLDLIIGSGGGSDGRGDAAGGFSGRVATAFGRLLRDLWSPCAPASVRPSELKASMGSYAARFAGYGQQDSEEFLRYLLEALHEDTNRVAGGAKRAKPPPINYEELDKLPDPEKADTLWKRYLAVDNSPIVDIFVGQLKSTLECCHCGYKSTTFDPFWDLALPIPSGGRSTTLEACLELFTSHESLDGDERPMCDSCKTRRPCTKSFSLYRLPRVLVVHLVRFSGQRYKTKLNTAVNYPMELDLAKFLDPDCQSRQSSPAATGCSRYSLYAVSEHSGTPYGGHYTAAVRHAYSHRWLAFNDSRCGASSPDAAVSPHGYVLFYELAGAAA